MSTLLRATVCSLATTYGIIFNCAGPACGSLRVLPLEGLFCTSDGTTLWCSNQQSCTGSNFVDDFQVTIKTDHLVADDYLVANGTQYKQRISTQIPGSTSSSSSTYPKHTSSSTHKPLASTFESKGSSETSTKVSQTRLSTSTQIQARSRITQGVDAAVINGIQKRARIDFIKALGEIPEASVAKVLGTFDASYAIAQDPQGVVKSLKSAAETLGIAIQGAVLPPVENILLDIAASRYEDAEKDSLQFVLETTLNAWVLAGAPPSAGADLPALLMTHALAAVVVNGIFQTVDEIRKEASAPASQSAPCPTAPSVTVTTASVPSPSVPSPSEPSQSMNSTLIVRSFRNRRNFV